MRNYDILFDRSERQIHFTKANCSRDLDKLIWNDYSQDDKNRTKENLQINETKNNKENNVSDNSKILNITNEKEKMDEQIKNNKTIHDPTSEIDKNDTDKMENLNTTIPKNGTNQNATNNLNDSEFNLDKANKTAQTNITTLVNAESTDIGDQICIL